MSSFPWRGVAEVAVTGSASDLTNGTTGSGEVVLATSPTLSGTITGTYTLGGTPSLAVSALTGTTLPNSIVNSSLTSLGMLKALTVSETDPTLSASFPAFAYPGTLTAPVVAYINSVWDASAPELSYTLSVQNVVDTGAITDDGATGAISAGSVISTSVVPDGATITTVITNTEDVVVAGNSAMWAIVRGPNIYAVNNTVDAIRVSNESSNTGSIAQNARSAFYVLNDLSYNAFYAGAWITSATQYGVVVGYPASVASVIVPIYPFAFLNGSPTPEFFVDNGGRIVGGGAGTTTANASLDIFSSITAPSLTYHSGGAFSFENETVGEFVGAFDSAGAFWAQARGGGGNVLPLALNPLGGNVGIGVAAPLTPLHVFGTATAPSGTANTGVLNVEGSDGVQFQVGSNPSSPYGVWAQVMNANLTDAYYPLSLNPLGGNVGIGTSNPGALLEVAGTAQIDSTLTVGGTLSLTPATWTDTQAGTITGQISVDANYIYVATAANTVKRVALSSF